VDSRPGFDDTGLLVILLVLAGIVVAVIGGAPPAPGAGLLGVLVGAPTPVFEIARGGQTASVVALVFALAATLVTSFVVRVLGRDA